MSNEVDNGKGAWTEEAKYQFLLHIIRHLRENNRTINWAKIKMGERSTKSLQNQWTKVNKQLAELDAQPSDSAPPTPNKATGKKGGKRAKVAENYGEDDDEPSSKKRAGGTRVKKEPGTKAEKTTEFDSMLSENYL